jgi:hypothetical protein
MEKQLKMLTRLLTGTLIFFAAAAFTPDINSDIAAAFRSGEAKQVSKFFADNVDMVVLDKEEVYSRSQAELILKGFFTKHAPKSFNIVHNGVSKNGSKFAIGSLVTANGNFKVTFFVKKEGDSYLIHQLRIEPEGE